MSERLARRARPAAILAAASVLVSTVGVTTTSAAAPTDIFFSEYLEGSIGTTKALELFNGTGAQVDLAGGYTIDLYANGSPSPTTTITLAGTIPDGGAFVIANPSSDPAVLAQADQLSASINFNGNDALILRHAGAVIDSIGQVGFDPGVNGWGIAPTSTTNSDLRRKSTVTAGDIIPTDVFDPAIEWIGFPDSAIEDLGTHTIDTGGGGGGGTASDHGTVGADVTLQAAAACIELSTSTISFGTLGFNAESVAATPDVTVTNCSTSASELLASGTNATGPTATWNLAVGASACPDLGLDNYRLALYQAGASPDAPALTNLALQNNTVLNLDPGASSTQSAHIWTPCAGSSGDGEKLTFQINYTAIVQE
jgi:uncharacterized protein